MPETRAMAELAAKQEAVAFEAGARAGQRVAAARAALLAAPWEALEVVAAEAEEGCNLLPVRVGVAVEMVPGEKAVATGVG